MSSTATPVPAGDDPYFGRRLRAVSRRSSALPYWLLLPSVAVMVVMLGYPLYRLVVLSLHEYGLEQIFGQPAAWVGLDNFREILTEDYFWTVLWRTLIFCAVNVALTMVLGVLVALLLNALGNKMRLLVATSLILAWAMPPLSATVVWQWIFDTQYGLVNWALSSPGHSWLAEPMSFFMVATIIVVWMGIPFVAFTTYAALSQIPTELIEAAHLDGAGPRRALALRDLPRRATDPVDPHVAVGALGFPGLHPGVRAPAGGRDLPRHEPARRVRLPDLDR